MHASSRSPSAEVWERQQHTWHMVAYLDIYTRFELGTGWLAGWLASWLITFTPTGEIIFEVVVLPQMRWSVLIPIDCPPLLLLWCRLVGLLVTWSELQPPAKATHASDICCQNKHSNVISFPSHHLLLKSQTLTTSWIKRPRCSNLDHVTDQEHAGVDGLPDRCPANN